MRYKQSCFLDGRITVHVKQPVNHTHGRLDRSHKLRFSHHQLYISAIHCHTTTNNAETCNQKVLFYQKKKKHYGLTAHSPRNRQKLIFGFEIQGIFFNKCLSGMLYLANASRHKSLSKNYETFPDHFAKQYRVLLYKISKISKCGTQFTMFMFYFYTSVKLRMETQTCTK